MLPHPHGEAASIVSAFHECSQALHGVNETTLDDQARSLLRLLTTLMDTSEVADPQGRGAWTVKAATFTVEQKFELARVIDELAVWFGQRPRKG